jgi:hypothetical protein
MFVVSSVDDLNFWLRRFAPRIELRISGDHVVLESNGATIQLTAAEVMSSGADDSLAALVSAGLRRLPRSRGILRPVVMVHGLSSHERRDGRAREALIGSLERFAVVAVVISEEK